MGSLQHWYWRTVAIRSQSGKTSFITEEMKIFWEKKESRESFTSSRLKKGLKSGFLEQKERIIKKGLGL